MIGSIVTAVSGLASSWIEGKTAIQKANAQIKMKEATGEIDWDLAAMRASQNSWKDEYLVIIFSIPLILSFCGEWGRGVAAAGFQALSEMPEWYQLTIGVIVSASFATRSAAKFINMRKKK
tara:strand:+ start:157 stop:519 length:363 start_codon:yes stop_codon:yes gene_type:complete